MNQIYSLQTNFPNGLNEYQLKTIILGNTGISETCLDVSRTDDVVTISFDNALSSAEVTTLNSIVSSYVYQAPLYPPDLSVNNNIINYTVGNTNFTHLADQPDEIHISKTSQTHYPSISAALQGNTGQNLVFIVHPGTYVEQNPLVLPVGASLYAEGHAENTIIVAANPNSDLITMGLKCKMEGFTIRGATNARGIYFDGTQSGGYGVFSAVLETFIIDCNIGIESDGKNQASGVDTLYAREVKISVQTTSTSKGIYCHSNGQVISDSVTVLGAPGYFTISDAVYCSDYGSKASLSVSSIWFCGNSIQINNGGEVEISLLTSKYNNNGVLFGNTGTNSKLDASLLNIQNSTTYDLSILPTNANVGIQSGNLDPSKINNPNNVNINARFTSNQFNTYYHNTTGQVNFGSKVIPTSMTMGQGTYDINGVSVLTNDNLEAGNWSDVTQAAITEVSTPFSIFPGVTAGNALYIGRNDNPVGVYFEVITGTTGTTNRNDLTWEYWNGTTWISFGVWQCSTIVPFYTLSNSFVSVAGTYNLRFGLTSQSPLVTKTLNGQSKYWVRCRIVNNLSSIPVGQYCKFHVNSIQIDNDGYQEYYGDSRSITSLPHWSQKLMSASVSTLQTTNLFLSSKLGFISDNAIFSAGQLSRVGINGFVPKDADLSFPVKIDVSLIGTGNTGGTVALTARWNTTNSGSNIYFGVTGITGPTGSAIAPSSSVGEMNQTILISTVNTESRGSFNLDFSNVVTNPSSGLSDLVWLSIERDATSSPDTYLGDIVIMQYNVSYVKMYSGGHLLSY
jgi:hypothetical protein